MALLTSPPLHTDGHLQNTSIMSSVKNEALDRQILLDLKQKLKCELVIKGESSDEKYQSAIDRWNKAYIQEAAIVAFPESENDISTSILFVKQWGLDLAISCGRYSYHGASSAFGLVIGTNRFTSCMKCSSYLLTSIRSS